MWEKGRMCVSIVTLQRSRVVMYHDIAVSEAPIYLSKISGVMMESSIIRAERDTNGKLGKFDMQYIKAKFACYNPMNLLLR
jgi:hypothetical protein